MRILIKKAKIIDSNSPFNGQTKDLLIDNDLIVKIEDEINDSAEQVIEKENLHISTGWFDLHAHFSDPGEEHKEDIDSGIKSAIKGGFTGVQIMPQTIPPISGKSQIEYVKARSKNKIVDLIPAGTLSENGEGKELSEMYDMYNAGAKAFTDDKHPVKTAGLMSRALLYSKNFGATIMSFPYDDTFVNHGQMHEGEMSTVLGMKGIPELSEDIIVKRDLELAKYQGSKIHFSTISSSLAVSSIENAKKENISVTCDVAAHQLLLTDKDLVSFDTRFKVLPPLRNEENKTALINAVKNGTITAICSDHRPEDIENKKREFEHAAFGMANISITFPIANTALKDEVSIEKIIELLSLQPRKILGLDMLKIDTNNVANLTLFNPEKEVIVENSDIPGKSKNTPFIGHKLTGQVYGILNNGQLNLCD